MEKHEYLCSGTLEAWLQENDPNSPLFPKPGPPDLPGLGHSHIPSVCQHWSMGSPLSTLVNGESTESVVLCLLTNTDRDGIF